MSRDFFFFFFLRAVDTSTLRLRSSALKTRLMPGDDNDVVATDHNHVDELTSVVASPHSKDKENYVYWVSPPRPCIRG